MAQGGEPGAARFSRQANQEFVMSLYKRGIFGYKSSYYCHGLERNMDRDTICCEVKCRFANICGILEATMRGTGRAHA